MFKRLLWLLLLLSTPLTAGASDRTLIDERENWDFIIDHFVGEIDRRRQVLNDIRGYVDTDLKRFDQECDRIQKRAGELHFLLWNQYHTELFGISLYNKQIYDLKRAFDAKIKRIREFCDLLQTRLDSNERQLRDINKAFAESRIDRSHDVVKRCLDELERRQRDIASYMLRYRNSLEKAAKIEADINHLYEEGEQRRQRTMTNVIFHPQDNFFQLLPEVWILVRLWMIDIKRWMAVQIPDDPAFWSRFLIIALLFWLPFFVFGQYLYSRIINMVSFPDKNVKFRAFMCVWGILTVSGACFSARWMLGDVESTPFARVGQFLFVLGCMTGALLIRLDRKSWEQCMILYTPLICQHLAGVFLCTLLIPYQLMIIVTPLLNLPVMMFTLYLLWRCKCPHLDRLFAAFTIIFSMVNMVLAFMGYGYIAFSLMLFWFVAVGGLQTGIAITSMVRSYAQNHRHRKIFTGLMLTILVPFVWLFIIGGMSYWVAGLYNAQELMVRILWGDFVRRSNIAEISIVDIITAIVVALLLRFIISSVQHLFRIIFQEKAEMGLILTFMTLGNYLAWGCYLIFLIILFKVHPSSILVVVGGMSMGVGFGLKEIVENFISGVILLAGKQLRPGDVIEFNGIWGRVRKVSVRATVVDTDDNSVITFPNSQVLSKDFRNWTLNNSLMRQEIKVGVAYNSDVALVMKLLRQIIDDEKNIQKSPRPDILFNDFGSSELIFKLRFWNSINVRHATTSNIRVAITERFAAHGIVIPYPQLDLHLDSGIVESAMTPRNLTGEHVTSS